MSVAFTPKRAVRCRPFLAADLTFYLRHGFALLSGVSLPDVGLP
ncbi:MAG TPA: hypothetical protein PK640_04890 [Verrucomicrobiota bacterium]|nr:hypothetical protein [Verrucomicrobiota bacterium]